MRKLLALAIVLAVAPAAAQQTEPLYVAVDAYARYQTDVSASLDAGITSAAAMDASVERAAHFEPAQLARGRLAYGAMIAAQARAFVAGVRARVQAAGRAAVVRQLVRDTTYARRRPQGASEAAALILAAMNADSARLGAASTQYETIGNSTGAAAWNTPLDTAQRDARDQRLRADGHEAEGLAPELAVRVHVAPALTNPAADAEAFGGAHFWDAVTGRASAPAPAQHLRIAPAGTDILDRMLTLGALYIVGATPEQRTRVDFLLDDNATKQCLTLEQLEFRQCVSVSHTPDEDAFCLARHGLGGPGACFSALAAAR